MVSFSLLLRLLFKGWRLRCHKPYPLFYTSVSSLPTLDSWKRRCPHLPQDHTAQSQEVRQL